MRQSTEAEGDPVRGPVPSLELDETVRGFREGESLFQSRYVLRRILGRGGMGVVWLAEDSVLQREVALKFLPDLVTRDKVAVRELKQETKRCLELTHPNIVRVHDFVEDPGRGIAAIAMEYIRGDNLSNLRSERESLSFEVEEVLSWVGQLCHALDYAHQRAKVVHRDLKPANLMVTEDGELKVADFGVARSLQESVSRISMSGNGPSSGTLAYMSPQQALGQEPRVSDDIYALGATLYDLLTGRPPFYRGNIYEQLQGVVPASITQRRLELGLKRNGVPPEWEKTIAACLEKTPEKRPRNVSEIASLLGVQVGRGAVGAETAGSVSDAVGRRLRTVFLGCLLCVGAGAATWWFGLEEPKRTRADALIAEAFGARLPQEAFAAMQKVNEALNLVPNHAGGLALRGKLNGLHADALSRQLAKVEDAMRNKDLLAAREACAELLSLQPGHPQATQMMAELVEARGGVEVPLKMKGMKVQVDDLGEVEAGRIEGLQLGKHTVWVRCAGHEPFRQEVDLRGRDFVRVEPKLVRQQGTLRITSQPQGVAVLVRMSKSPTSSEEELKFLKQGSAPLVLENLPTGDYEVHFALKGAPEFARLVEVSSGASASCTHEFALGALTLKTTPEGLEAVLLRPDGSVFQTAKTPVNLEGVPVGAYRVVMKREGFADHVEEFTLEKGGNLTLSHEFSGTPLKKNEVLPKEAGTAADAPPRAVAAPGPSSVSKPPQKSPASKPHTPARSSDPVLDEFLRRAQSFERR